MKAVITYSRALIADQRGIVLYSSLMLLTLIMAVGVQAIVSTQSNFQMSANLRSENVAFYISEAGIEYMRASEVSRRTRKDHRSSAAYTEFFLGNFLWNVHCGDDFYSGHVTASLQDRRTIYWQVRSIFADRPSRADQAFSIGRRRRRIAGKRKPPDLGRQ